MFIYIWERERVQAEQGQREGDKGSNVGSALTAARLMRGSNSQTKRSWPELKSDDQPAEPPKCPYFSPFELYRPITALTSRVWHMWCYVIANLTGQSTSILVSGRHHISCHITNLTLTPPAKESTLKGHMGRARKI